MDLCKYRDYWFLFRAMLFFWLYIPHFLCLLLIRKRENYRFLWEDVSRFPSPCYVNWMTLLFLLHNNSYFRSLFYYRIGPVRTLLIGWYRPGNRYFILSWRTKIEGGFYFAHPYATILNAERIGENFSCIHCTTLGEKGVERPIIGDHVSLGANVTIIGKVRIGNNVTIGAGSVVVKDIPDNCIVAGNPARIIRKLESSLCLG